MDWLGWMIQVVLRLQQTQGFVLLKKRSVVEQTFGLLN
jgi:transposase